MSIRTIQSRLLSTSLSVVVAGPSYRASAQVLPVIASCRKSLSTSVSSITYRSHLHPQSFRRSATTLAASSLPSSSQSGLFSTPQSQTPIRVIPPSLEAIKAEGYLDDDVNLLPQDEARLNITPEAIQQLVRITAREPPDILAQDKLALRVGVESGGCHGYQYTMAITEDRGVDDYVLQPEGGKQCIPVVIDLISFGLLKGATLHHATELIGSSFRLQDNPQAKEGGACGCGVSWEAK